MSIKTTTGALLTFMANYGRAYLASGGPTSRVEDALSHIGLKLGYPTEVFATPTGIFVSCIDEAGEVHTTLSRIKEGGINFERMCWLEKIFDEVISGKLSITQANKILHGKRIQKPPYTRTQMVFAAFIAGFALSYPSFGLLIPAIASGLIATLTWWLAGPGLIPKVQSSIFRDFFGCIVGLGASGLVQYFIPAPFEAFSIGSLIILVPGLALTTAISELADQNLVSGTAKLMQAILTLLALALAYILFQDLSNALGVVASSAPGSKPLALGVSALGAAISVSCFGILFRVPVKSLPWATATGLLGWFVLKMFGSAQFMAAASFLASLCVGLVSLGLGKVFRVPSQVFSVPGILAMLPGMLAFTSMRSFTMGQQSSGVELAVRVLLTAGSIVFGLFSARIPAALRPPTLWRKVT